MTPESKINRKHSDNYCEALAVKRKLDVLSQMIGKDKLQSINYALDVALAFEKTRLTMEALKRTIEVAKHYLGSLNYLIAFKRKQL